MARAIFVSGPVGTSVIEFASARLRVSIMKSTACIFLSLVSGSNISIPSIPVLPWTFSAVTRSTNMGREQPENTFAFL